VSTRELLIAAEGGLLPACEPCPWNPRIATGVAFGVSCEAHGVPWSTEARAVTMQVVQDPAGTTPERTGRLCFVCNSANASDRTAHNNYALWRAGVAIEDGPNFLAGHYWTNAIMHGRGGPTRDAELPRARHCCREVLGLQIQSLRPRVIIASGVCAADSLRELGYFRERWSRFNSALGTGPHVETSRLPDGEPVTVVATYHTAAKVINMTAADRYSDATELALAAELERQPRNEAAMDFLPARPADTSPGRGLRVLLLHWLRIGTIVRSAYA
jgi:uracil-DNA glycosylase